MSLAGRWQRGATPSVRFLKRVSATSGGPHRSSCSSAKGRGRPGAGGTPGPCGPGPHGSCHLPQLPEATAHILSRALHRARCRLALYRVPPKRQKVFHKFGMRRLLACKGPFQVRWVWPDVETGDQRRGKVRVSGAIASGAGDTGQRAFPPGKPAPLMRPRPCGLLPGSPVSIKSAGSCWGLPGLGGGAVRSRAGRKPEGEGH